MLPKFKDYENSNDVIEQISEFSEEILNFTYRLFSKYFIDGELMRSTNTRISFPIVILMDSLDGEKTIPMITSMTSNCDHISPVEVICAYNCTTHDFVWLTGSVKSLSDQWFEGINIAQKSCIRNVSRDNAVKLALWYRTMYYECGAIYLNAMLQGVDPPNNIHTNMKTTNLVQFSIVMPSG